MIRLALRTCGLIVMLFALSHCRTTTTNTPGASPQTGNYSLQSGTTCQRFVDTRTGLSFCVPQGATLHKSPRFSALSQGSFEARITLPGRNIEMWVRRDPLPEDLPEGALSGAWLMRYTEGYAQHRGAPQAQLQRKLLPPPWTRHLKADAATWAAFPLSGDGPHQWEEVLILARKRPAVRVVVSLRLSLEERQERKKLFKLLILFVKHLRLSKM